MTSAASPVPRGFHTVTPFLNLKGVAGAAEFYRMAFDAEEHVRYHGPDGTIVHVELSIGNSTIMLAEAVNDPVSQSTCHIYSADSDRLWEQATRVGAEIVVDLQDMAWGDRFGLLIDPWNIRWAIRRRNADLSPEALQAILLA